LTFSIPHAISDTISTHVDLTGKAAIVTSGNGG
jgi:hypothetical protein